MIFQGTVAVRQPRDVTELHQGLELLGREFVRKFSTFPRELPDQFFLAWKDAELIGCINIQLGPGPLEVEKYFKCTVEDFFHSERSRVAEIGRLVCVERKLAPVLFCAATLFCQRFGIDFLVSFNRGVIAKIMNSDVYGFPVNIHMIPLRENFIPKAYWPYFKDSDDPVVVLTQERKLWDARANEIATIYDSSLQITLPDSTDGIRSLYESRSNSRRPQRISRHKIKI